MNQDAVLTLDGKAFTVGRAVYRDHRVGGRGPTARIHVKIRAGVLEPPLLAELDTGAPWSCLAPGVAEAAGAFDGPGEATRLQTAFGVFEGHLVVVPIELVADEGKSVQVEATVFVTRSEGWPEGRSFLGYGGLLERIRLGLDPQHNHVYFGPSEESA